MDTGLLKNKMTTKELEVQIALGTLSYDQKLELVENPNTSKKILTLLSKDENWYVKCCVAENLNTPTNILAKLSTDENRVVRYYVVCNPNTSKEI